MHGIMGRECIVAVTPDVPNTWKPINQQRLNSKRSQSRSRIETAVTRPYEGKQLILASLTRILRKEEALNSPTINTAASLAVN